MFDVCLVAEGTYPYVTGGVSAWVDDHLRDLAELRFAVVHLRDGDEPARAQRYAPPANASVVDVALDPDRARPGPAAGAGLPEARVFHGLATGAAGAVAAGAAATHGRPFVLTEHGLAWEEAAAGISGCKPNRAPGRRDPAARERTTAGVRAMARQSYAEAVAVTSVCGRNARIQRQEGAPAGRSHVLPNAVGPSPIASGHGAPLRVGLVGRVVGIKDVETFVRACAQAAPALPGAEFVVVGPLDHDAAYTERCRRLADALGLGERLRFTGERGPGSEPLDVVVLTSLGEAQPRALLEAMAAGVPVVTTAVGGCPELVGGPDPAGLLTGVRDPRATARAIVRLCRDGALRAALGDAGRRRAGARHAPDRVHGAWRTLYERVAEAA